MAVCRNFVKQKSDINATFFRALKDFRAPTRRLVLQVHPYTFRNEDSYLAWTWAQDPYPEMYAFVEQEGIDGFFTDFPDTAVAFRHRLALGDVQSLDIETEPGVQTPPVYCRYYLLLK